jgi:TatD DNase family protein
VAELALVDVLCQPALTDDPSGMLDAMAAVGVRRALCASVDADRSIAIAHDRLEPLRGVGLLPSEIAGDDKRRSRQLADVAKRLAENDVRFLGEVGLDRRPAMPPLGIQELALEVLLLAAAEHQRPVLLHVVRAHGSLLDVLGRVELDRLSLAVHGYTGAAAAAEDLCRRGLFISFGPGLLNADAKRAQDAAEVVPDAHLLVESDAPTHPPAAIVEVVERLAKIRGTTPEAIAELTAANAARWLKEADRAS